MASAISTDSLIAALFPGLSPAAAPSARGPAVAAVPPAVTYTPGMPGGKDGQSGGAGPLVYSRRDARGGTLSGRATGESEATVTAPDDPAAQGNREAPAAGEPEARPKAADAAAQAKKPSGEAMTEKEVALLRELQRTDQSVRAHEMAHLAAAGGYAKGGASFSYQRGPDGQSYAVGGEVQIDTGRERTPEATILKMQIVRQAALAPADPSPQDQRVAASATLQIAQATKEMFELQAQKSQAAMQAMSQSRESEGEGEEATARAIYQEAGRGLGQASPESQPTSVAPSGRVSAYQAAPAGQTGRQGQAVDRVV